MKSTFLNWYTQSLGATLGIIASIYAYLNGYMFVYSNISRNFDNLSFGGVISSYFLLPLCIITLLLGLAKSCIDDKIIYKISLKSFNKLIIIMTVIVGFLGAHIYFVFPAIFILFEFYEDKIKIDLFNHNEELDKELSQEVQIKDKVEAEIENKIEIDKDNDLITRKDLLQSEKSKKILLTKIEMTKDLLTRKANKQFIMEITGLSLNEIENIENKL
ncbi:hypothetical protein CHF27_010660 [Romboutsia maritimum]|uniref:Uncharacterized protein n=1 Tax=Romboutsia maritimum TaxID=2020948 RepID=A0A371IR54_9FIRM|nr:hypothetical protein [Romboutsia maritimum]RDY22958.1 hypothetical protein CHF27_010660 [Romboutsia maritimum]